MNDYSIHAEIHDCVINLQGQMNDLKRDLRKQGNDADAEYIGEVVKAVEEMQEVTGSVSKNKDIAEILAKKGAKDAKTYGLLQLWLNTTVNTIP